MSERSESPALQDTLADHPGKAEGDSLVFVTRDGKPLAHNYMHRVLRNIGRRAGFTKPVRPHLFRHSRITGLLRDGTHEAIVKKMAWENGNTPMLAVYEHQIFPQLQKIYQNRSKR